MKKSAQSETRVRRNDHEAGAEQLRHGSVERRARQINASFCVQLKHMNRISFLASSLRSHDGSTGTAGRQALIVRV